MKVTMTSQQLGAWVLRLLSLAAVALAAIPATSLPASVRPFLALAGGIVLAVDRFVTDPSTGTPAPTPPAPTPPAPAVPAQIPATPPAA